MPVITPPAVSLDVAARFAATIERRRLPLAALFTGTGASLLGRQLATLAVPVAIYASTDSLAQASLTAACLIFPWLLTDPSGNAFAARIGHKPASIAASIAGSAIVAMIPVFNLATRLPFATILLAVVLFAVITALGSASRHTLMPEAADLAGQSADQIGGVLQSVARMAVVGGTLLAGLGVMQLGQDATLGIAAALIAIAAVADTFLVAPAALVPTPVLPRIAIPSTTPSQRPAGTLDQP